MAVRHVGGWNERKRREEIYSFGEAQPHILAQAKRLSSRERFLAAFSISNEASTYALMLNHFPMCTYAKHLWQQK